MSTKTHQNFKVLQLYIGGLKKYANMKGGGRGARGVMLAHGLLAH